MLGKLAGARKLEEDVIKEWFMNESYIQQLFADRIGGSTFGKDTVLYKFEKIKRAKRAALAAHPGVPLIDLGVGEPDWMAEPEVVDVLCAEARKPENRGYTDNGLQPFKDAAVRYMASGERASSRLSTKTKSLPQPCSL